MKRIGLIVYLANWYAFAVSGWLMAAQDLSGTWLAGLPWTSWGTELADGLAGTQAVSGGALWLLMGVGLAIIGVLGSVAASMIWLAARSQERQPAVRPPLRAPAPARAGPLSQQSQEATALVEDPQLRALIQRLDARLG